MKVGRSTKEFATFGIIVAGKHVFFNSLKLDVVDGAHRYCQHSEAFLPSFESTTAEMKLFLEAFPSFKVIILDSKYL
ncbi:unnamed protein product [Mucor circinelloides]